MSTTTTVPQPIPQPAATDRPPRTIAPIPMSRLVSVELRKMFDTRSGFWLLAGIAITAVLATGAVIAFAPDEALTYSAFATAIGVPISILLPIIGVLAVTSEYSQRTGLTTYTLVPRRGRVIVAKAIATLVVGIVSMLIAMAVGALGTVVGSAIAGVPQTWDSSITDLTLVALANVVGMAVGFMLGAVIRSSAAAIVGYFVYQFVLPGIFGALAIFQAWFSDLRPWVDFRLATTTLYDGGPTSEQWAQFGVSGLVWLVLPLAVGVRLLMRSEVK